MRLGNTTASWGLVSRLIHWTMAGIIFFLIGVGFYMSNVLPTGLEQFAYIQIHKSWGFVVFVLAVLRVAWRWMSPRTPAMPKATMSRFEIFAAKTAHILLYVLIFALPLTGWLMSTSSPLNDANAYPFPVQNLVFGAFDMPDPYPTGDQTLSDIFHTAHIACAVVLCLVLLAHIAGALKHAVLKRDGVLARMTFGRFEPAEVADHAARDAKVGSQKRAHPGE
ncbi:MAG: cytochrome b [Pseudomonadota bacterium]